MPAMPAHIQQAAARAGYQIPKAGTPLNNKQLMAEYAAAVKDGRMNKRALKQAVQFYNQVKTTYGPNSKAKRKGKK